MTARTVKGLVTLALIVMSFAYSHLYVGSNEGAATVGGRPTPGLPPRPTPGLPPRPTLEQTTEPTPVLLTPTEGDAFIELHLASRADDLTAVVQWLDGLGEWQDVDGWRNHIEPTVVTRWWVAPDDQATGPFRWVVYRLQDGNVEVICSSPAFILPVAGQTLRLNCIAD